MVDMAGSSMRHY